MLSYFQLLCHWLFNLLDNTLEIQWMTQWKTHMCQIYFALLWSLQVFSASKSYCVGGLKFYSSFPHFNSQPWDHPNCFWFFLCLTRPACQDASDSPSALLALNPIKYIRKGSKREKKSLLSLDPCFSATSLVPCNLQGNGNQEFVQLLQVFQEGSFLHGMLLHHDW